ncbi:MAG TPA: hypothetical protein VMF31_00635 [Solirubrobacterales bacterium]|nr:hypothetical protein [Solirubrobacterales bacterium]
MSAIPVPELQRSILEFIYEVETTTQTVDWGMLECKFPDESEETLKAAVDELDLYNRVTVVDTFICSVQRAGQSAPEPIDRTAFAHFDERANQRMGI